MSVHAIRWHLEHVHGMKLDDPEMSEAEMHILHDPFATAAEALVRMISREPSHPESHSHYEEDDACLLQA